jgi:hypothetical protein
VNTAWVPCVWQRLAPSGHHAAPCGTVWHRLYIIRVPFGAAWHLAKYVAPYGPCLAQNGTAWTGCYVAPCDAMCSRVTPCEYYVGTVQALCRHHEASCGTPWELCGLCVGIMWHRVGTVWALSGHRVGTMWHRVTPNGIVRVLCGHQAGPCGHQAGPCGHQAGPCGHCAAV